MSGGDSGAKRHYTKHQQKIIKNFYENKDARVRQRLGEIVSDLYLEGNSKKANRLWKSVEKLLLDAGVPPSRVEVIIGSKDLNALAKTVSDTF